MNQGRRNVSGKAAGNSDGRKTNFGGARGGAESAGCKESMRASREDFKVDVGGQQPEDLILGGGPKWELGEAVAARKQVQRTLEVDEELKRHADLLPWTAEYIEKLESELESRCAEPDARCKKMLDQAMSKSREADVQFVFEEERSHLSGHRGMLCAGSELFAAMFRHEMKEAQEGKVHVQPGIDVSSFRGFLEWLYLGRAGEKCAQADGRQLWVLGDMYQVAELKEWLLSEGIHKGNFRAVREFGLAPEVNGRGEIVSRCEEVAEEGERNGAQDADENQGRGEGAEFGEQGEVSSEGGSANGERKKAEAATSFEEGEEEEGRIGETKNQTGKKKKRGRDEEKGRMVEEGDVPQSYMKRTRSGATWGVSERVLKPAKSTMKEGGSSSKPGLMNTGSRGKTKLDDTGWSSKASKSNGAGAELVKVSGGKVKEIGKNYDEDDDDDNNNNNNNNNNKFGFTKRSRRGSGASSKSVVKKGQPGKVKIHRKGIDMNKMIGGLTFAEQILKTKYCGKMVARRNGFEWVYGVVRRIAHARKSDLGVDLFIIEYDDGVKEKLTKEQADEQMENKRLARGKQMVG